jgi:TPR repeat protein
MTKRRCSVTDWMSALFLCALLAGNTTFAAALDDGKAAYETGDYKTALSLWRPLAEQGNAEAQRSLGWMYETGKGVARDEAQATLWYRKAAEQGDAKAQYRLGVVYVYNGTPTADDVAIGLSWFEKAANQGDVKAQSQLGELYGFGDFGVSKNSAKAAAWLRKAAEQADVLSVQRLILFSALSRDGPAANIWSRKLAELGNPWAQYELGVEYADGLRVPKDDTKAMFWLGKAASQRGFYANLARAYLERMQNPNPLPTPPPSDFDAIRHQAESGSAEAQERLGEIYRDKRSILRDYAKSVIWFRKAADQG